MQLKVTKEEVKYLINNMIKGQIAFGGGFNSQEDIDRVVNSIIFGLFDIDE